MVLALSSQQCLLELFGKVPLSYGSGDPKHYEALPGTCLRNVGTRQVMYAWGAPRKTKTQVPAPSDCCFRCMFVTTVYVAVVAQITRVTCSHTQVTRIDTGNTAVVCSDLLTVVLTC